MRVGDLLTEQEHNLFYKQDKTPRLPRTSREKEKNKREEKNQLLIDLHSSQA